MSWKTFSCASDCNYRHRRYLCSDSLGETLFRDTVTRFGYDDIGRLDSVGKPDGFSGTIAYSDDTTQVGLLEDNEGQSMRFEYDYDTQQELSYSATTSPSGEVKEVWFDGLGNTRHVDVDGATLRTMEKDGEEDTFEFDEPKQRLARKSRCGAVAEYGDSDDDRLTRLAESVGTPQERITEYDYRADGNRSFMRLTQNAGRQHSA
ncbi:MAG: hypothetical protein GY801_06140 [bacterium]|nr:hypothetical protein [bacterium]